MTIQQIHGRCLFVVEEAREGLSAAAQSPRKRHACLLCKEITGTSQTADTTLIPQICRTKLAISPIATRLTKHVNTLYKQNCKGYLPSKIKGQDKPYKPELKIRETKPNGPYVDSDYDKSRPDRAVPTDEDRRLSAGMMAGRLPGTLSLRDAASSKLRLAAGRAAVPPEEASVDDAIADKPVCVYGESFSTK